MQLVMVLVESNISSLSIHSYFNFILLVKVFKVVSDFWWERVVTLFARLPVIMKRGIYPM